VNLAGWEGPGTRGGGLALLKSNALPGGQQDVEIS